MTEEMKPEELSIGLVIGDHDHCEALVSNGDIVTLGAAPKVSYRIRYAAVMHKGLPVVMLNDEAVLSGPQELADAMARHAEYHEHEARRWRGFAEGVSAIKDWPNSEEYVRQCLEIDAREFCSFDDIAKAAIEAHIKGMSTAQLAELVGTATPTPEEQIPF